MKALCRRHSDMKLICFPHAGGFASYYKFISGYDFSNADQVLIYEYTGRSTRSKEPPAETFGECLTLAYQYVLSALTENDEYALFGHSMGAFVAYETACRMTDAGRPPRIVILSGQKPVCDVEKSYYTDSPEIAFQMIEKLGGLPDYIRDHKELMKTFYSLTLSDFRLLSSYVPTTVHPQGKPPLGVLMCGTDDAELEGHNLEKWKLEFENFLGVKYFLGDHFYLKNYRSEVCRMIDGLMAEKARI